MRHIYKCVQCNKYTMNEVCGCGSKTLPAKPVKYTVDDKFASYRRKAKAEHYKKMGLI